MGKPKKKKDFFVNPLKKKNIGWRSGQDILAGKVITVNKQGFENLEDYYSESDADFTQDLTANISRVTRSFKENKSKENKPINENQDTKNEALPQNSRMEYSQTGSLASSQSSNMFAWLKNKNVGRRTGKNVLAGKVITKNSQGFDNIEDYFSESSDADSMFLSKSRISVGLDNTFVVTEKSDSVSQVPQAANDDQVSNDSDEDSCPTPKPHLASIDTSVSEPSEIEDTPTNKRHSNSEQGVSGTGKDEQTSSHKAVKRQSRGRSKTQDVSSDDDEIQFKSNTDDTSGVKMISELTAEVTDADQTSDNTGVADRSPKVTPVTDKVSNVPDRSPEVTGVTDKVQGVTDRSPEVTCVTDRLEEANEKLTDDHAENLAEKITVADKTSEVTAILGKSKSYISTTINIGGNVTGSLTKCDDQNSEYTGPIPSFRTRKKLSFSALEKSLMIKEDQKKKRSASEVSPVINNSNPFIKSRSKSASTSIVKNSEDSSQVSASESLDQPSDSYVEEEFRIVSDDSVSKIAEAKRKSKGGAKITRRKSQSQGRKSAERNTTKDKNITDSESSIPEKAKTEKSIGKRKSQIISARVVDKDTEANSQNSKTLKRKSMKRKSNDESESLQTEVKIAKSEGRRKSQINQIASNKDFKQNILENSKQQDEALKRKSVASDPSTTSDQNSVKDKHSKGNDDLSEKQSKQKKRKSQAVKRRTMLEGNITQKVEYCYDSDNSSVIIEEYEKQLEKELKSRKSRSHKPDNVSDKPTKPVTGDQNLELNKNTTKKRRQTFVLGDDDSEMNDPLECSPTDTKTTKDTVSATEGRSSRSKVNNTSDISPKKRGKKTISLQEKKQGDVSSSENVSEDTSKKECSMVKKPLKRIGGTSRKSCPQTIPTPQLNDTEDSDGGDKKTRKKSVLTHQEMIQKDDEDQGRVTDTWKSQDCVSAADEDLPYEDLPVEEDPCEDIPGNNVADDNIPDDIEEEEEENNPRNLRPRRAGVAKRKPVNRKTKGSGLLKQTLAKNKAKKGVNEKKREKLDQQLMVLKTTKAEPTKAPKTKNKNHEEQVFKNEPQKVSSSKSDVHSKAKGKRKQKVSVGYVKESSSVCSVKISAKTSPKTSDSRTSSLDLSEAQEVDLNISENISNVQSSQKNTSSRKNSLSNQKSKKRKGKKGENIISKENDDDEEEEKASAAMVSHPLPSDSNISKLSLSKKSDLRRSLLVNTMHSPQGSFTPLSATPGSEFSLARREEMLRSGVSFRQLKVDRSGKKSTPQNRKISNAEINDKDEDDDENIPDDDENIPDNEENNPNAEEDVQDEVDCGDENDFPQNDIDDDFRDVQVSPDQLSTSNRKHLSKRKSGGPLGQLDTSHTTPKSSSSPANLTPCLVTPGRKSLGKARRVTISNQVTETVYKVPSDSSSPDSPKASKVSRRSSILGGDFTTYISMSSTPVHVCEMTTTETPKPIQKPEKHKIVLPDPSPPQGLRRSNRTRVQTLEWYKNERVDYKCRKSGGFVVAGIIPSQEAKILEHERKKREKLQKAHRGKKRRSKAKSPPRNLSMHTPVPSDMNLTVSDEVLVINPETEEEVYVECFASKESGSFVGPTGKKPTPEDPFLMSRTLDQKGFGTGVLILRPLQEKTVQMVSRGTLIFLLERGVVTMSIHKASVIMEAGDSAFVPRGNTYSIKNLRSEEAKLFYTVLKDTLDSSDIWTS